jgi:hypothetical protein
MKGVGTFVIKNIGNFTTLLKPNNIGTHLKCIETSFQVIFLGELK